MGERKYEKKGFVRGKEEERKKRRKVLRKSE